MNLEAFSCEPMRARRCCEKVRTSTERTAEWTMTPSKKEIGAQKIRANLGSAKPWPRILLQFQPITVAEFKIHFEILHNVGLRFSVITNYNFEKKKGKPEQSWSNSTTKITMFTDGLPLEQDCDRNSATEHYNCSCSITHNEGGKDGTSQKKV